MAYNQSSFLIPFILDPKKKLGPSASLKRLYYLHYVHLKIEANKQNVVYLCNGILFSNKKE